MNLYTPAQSVVIIFCLSEHLNLLAQRFKFDLGEKKLLINVDHLSDEERIKIEQKIKKRRNEVVSELEEEDIHTEMQHHILTIGIAIGYEVIAAANDR